MDVREKLVELLNEVQETGVNEIPAGFGCTCEYVNNEKVASHLIANGVTVQEWISVEDRLPEMYDAGILKKIGIMQRSRKVIAAISDGKEWIVDNNAELRDGKWYSDTIRFLEAGKKQFKVTHWMPLPEPYKERRTDE